MLNLYRESFSGLSREVWLLAVVNLINRAGTMVIPFLTIFLSTELGFTMKDAGWIMSFFGLGSVVGTFIGGQITDKYGYRGIMFWSLLLGGCLFFSLQFVTTFWGWCFMIFMASAVADSFRPASMTAVAILSKPENRTRSVSLIRLAINMGWAVGPAVAGILAEYVGYNVLFWGDGLTFIGAAIFFILMIPVKTSINSDEEEEELATTTEAKSVYHDFSFIAFVVLLLISAIAFFQLFSTIPLYFEKELNLSKALIGGLMSVNGILISIVEMPAVFVLEKKYKSLALSAIGCLMIGVSYLVLSFTTWVWIALISTILVSLGEVLAMPFANAFALNRPKAENRGRYMALYGMSYSVGFIIAPILGTQIADEFGWDAMWICIAMFSFVAGVGLWYLSKRVEREKEIKILKQEAAAELV